MIGAARLLLNSSNEHFKSDLGKGTSLLHYPSTKKNTDKNLFSYPCFLLMIKYELKRLTIPVRCLFDSYAQQFYLILAVVYCALS